MKRRLQGGFSLVEMLIGLMLTALILQAIPPLLSTAFVSWRQSVARTATHQSGRMAMEAMTRELRLASQIVSPLPGQARPGSARCNLAPAVSPSTRIPPRPPPPAARHPYAPSACAIPRPRTRRRACAFRAA